MNKKTEVPIKKKIVEIIKHWKDDCDFNEKELTDVITRLFVEKIEGLRKKSIGEYPDMFIMNTIINKIKEEFEKD
jgi:hypothetical protein